MASDDFDIVIEAMLEAPYKKEEVRILKIRNTLNLWGKNDLCCILPGVQR